MKAIKSMFKKKAPPLAEAPSGMRDPEGFQAVAAPRDSVTAAFTLSPDEASSMSQRALNSRAAKCVMSNLDARLKAAQHEGIARGLKAAKDMFRVGTGRQVGDVYRIGKLLGTGAFAKVFEGVNRITGDKAAVKFMSKGDPCDLTQRIDVLTEVAIMHLLAEHPHTIDCEACFETADDFIVVTELCHGGELFDAIVKRHHLTEKEAASILKPVISVVHACYELGIVHRDLKPENILLKDEKSLHIKIIDFGASCFCAAGQLLQQEFGTPYYVAPEVLHHAYAHRADVWSSGVIMYILICGYPPFGGSSDEKILQRIKAGKFSYEGKEWRAVSQEAMHIISAMLTHDHLKRPLAEALLKHKWFKIQEELSDVDSNPIGAMMMDRLQQFGGMQRMKRLALACLVRTLNNRDVKNLLKHFEEQDPEKTGFLDHDSFHVALAKVGATMELHELESMIAMFPEGDRHGRINYNDFVAAMLDTSCVAQQQGAVRRSFEVLDTDGDGKITANDIVQASGGRLSVHDALEMVGETVGRTVRPSEEAEIDYATFEKMMRA